MERMRTTHPHGPGATLRATSLAAVTAFASAPALAATSLALPGVFSDFTLREWLLGASLLLLVLALVGRLMRSRETPTAAAVVADAPDLRWWRNPLPEPLS